MDRVLRDLCIRRRLRGDTRRNHGRIPQRAHHIAQPIDHAINVSSLVIPVIMGGRSHPNRTIPLLQLDPAQIPSTTEAIGSVIIVIFSLPNLFSIHPKRHPTQPIKARTRSVVDIGVVAALAAIDLRKLADQIVGPKTHRNSPTSLIREALKGPPLGRWVASVKIIELHHLPQVKTQDKPLVDRIVRQRLLGVIPWRIGPTTAQKPHSIVDRTNRHNVVVPAVGSLDQRRYLLHKPAVPVDSLVGRRHSVPITAGMTPR